MKIFSDQNGQASTEYIVLMAIAVSLVFILKKALQPIFSKISQSIALGFENKLFGTDLHKFPIK